MNSNEMTNLVIKRLTDLKCPPIAKVTAISKGKKEWSYKILTDNPQITLKQFLKEMNLEEE